MKHVTQPAITTEEKMFHFVVRELVKQGRPALKANGQPTLRHYASPRIGCAIALLGHSEFRSELEFMPSNLSKQLQAIHDGPALDPANFVAGVKAQARRVAAVYGFSLPLEAL